MTTFEAKLKQILVHALGLMPWITPRLAPVLLAAVGAVALLGRRRRRRVLRGMTKAQIWALRRRHFSPAQSVS